MGTFVRLDVIYDVNFDVNVDARPVKTTCSVDNV